MLQTIAKRYSIVNSNLHISLLSRLLSNGVMEIKEIRRRNLVLLIDSRGHQADLAHELSMAPSIISNIVNEERGMGHGIARRIEKKLHLERGWMDTPQAKAELPDRLRTQLLYFYENLSADARDALLGKANTLFIGEHPEPSTANPYPAKSQAKPKSKT